MNDDELEFKRYLPKVTEVTVVKAAKAWGEGDHIRSLDGKRTAIDAFILQMATDLEVRGPYLMNATCARALCSLLIAGGFGPQEA